MFPGSDVLDDRTIVSFTIKFQPNQPDFSADRYGAEFNRAIQAASTFGNAVVVIRGHADPTKALIDMIKAGMEKGIIKRSGQPGNYRYFVNGKPISLENTAEMIRLIESGAFESDSAKPRDMSKPRSNLSLSRAESVKQSLVDFAKQTERQFGRVPTATDRRRHLGTVDSQAVEFSGGIGEYASGISYRAGTGRGTQ